MTRLATQAFSRTIAETAIVVFCAGVPLFFVGRVNLLGREGAATIRGGKNGVGYIFTPCPAQTNCGAIKCQKDPDTGNIVCPQNTTEYNQLIPPPGYPSGSAPPGNYNPNNIQQVVYTCGFQLACANPCLQSTVFPFNEYCSGPVGNNLGNDNRNGIQLNPLNEGE